MVVLRTSEIDLGSTGVLFFRLLSLACRCVAAEWVAIVEQEPKFLRERDFHFKPKSAERLQAYPGEHSSRTVYCHFMHTRGVPRGKFAEEV
jgi:hypothetical protein